MLRERKQLSQGDIEKRSGLLRCYISRVENGHTVPCIETLEKMARAMDVPMYELFYDGEGPPQTSILPRLESGRSDMWGTSGKDGKMLNRFRKVLSRLDAKDLELLLSMAQKMAQRRGVKA
jgi:transcriptional regulator with XRE-family HTH domain